MLMLDVAGYYITTHLCESFATLDGFLCGCWCDKLCALKQPSSTNCRLFRHFHGVNNALNVYILNDNACFKYECW